MICGSFFSSPPFPLFPSTYYTFHLRSVFGHVPTLVFPSRASDQSVTPGDNNAKKAEKTFFGKARVFPSLLFRRDFFSDMSLVIIWENKKM